MNTMCSCGFDCSTFVAFHAIPAGGRFDCPQCEQPVQAAEQALAVFPPSAGEKEVAELVKT